MPATTVWEQAAATVVAVDGDTGWKDTSAYGELDVEIQVTAASVPSSTEAVNSVPNISFYLEGQEPSGDVVQLWQAVFYEPFREHTSVGPSLPTDREVPPSVRLRWTLNGASVTFGASIVGR